MLRDIKVVLLLIIVILIVGLSAGLFLLKEKSKMEKADAIDELDSLRPSLSRLEDISTEKEKVNNELDKKLKAVNRDVDALEVQVTRIDGIFKETENWADTTGRDIKNTQNKIRSIKKEKIRIQSNISMAESEIEELKSRRDILNKTMKALERHRKKMIRVKGVRAVKAAPPQIKPRDVKPMTYVEATPARSIVHKPKRPLLSGEVLVINREFNFVVVSLGKEDGLREGDELFVYDGEKLLGIVSIETVRQNISAATGGKDLDSYRMRVGNKISSRKL